MASFLYWWPERDVGVSRSHAGAAGLAYAFDREIECTTGYSGPDGNKGAVFGQRDDTKIDLPNQTWRKIPKSPVNAWVGFDNDARPGPGDLLRDKGLPGHFTGLLDGNEWLIPVARGVVEDGDGLGWYVALPCDSALDDDGNWTDGDVTARYAGLWQLACDWFQHQCNAGKKGTKKISVQTDFKETRGHAATVLAVNYRIGAVEAAMLNVFDSSQAASRIVLNTLIDVPTIEQFAEKKTGGDRGGSRSSDGPADSIEATAPALPT